MTTERKPTDWMGGSGFVFLDDRYVPYLVRQESSGDWWLYGWRLKGRPGGVDLNWPHPPNAS